METKNLILTPDLKSKLKDFVAFDVSASFPYVPKIFREKDKDGKLEIPKEFWTVFKLKSKDGLQIAKVEDEMGYVSLDNKTNETKMQLRSGTIRLNTLRDGILSVKNFITEDGSRISWDHKMTQAIITGTDGKENIKNGIKIDFIIAKMRAAFQVEIANAINERKTLTEEELQGLDL